jgi:hypothetical protein
VGIAFYTPIAAAFCLAVGYIVCKPEWSKRKQVYVYSLIWLAAFLFLTGVDFVTAISLAPKDSYKFYEACGIVHFLAALVALPPLGVLALTSKKLSELSRD